MTQVKLKKSIVIEADAVRITELSATLEDGSIISVAGPISVGDWAVTDSDKFVSILSAANYAAELVI